MGRMQIGNASFYENVEKGVPYRHPKRIGPKPKRVQFGTFKVPITLSCSGAFWTPFLGFLGPVLALRCVLNPYSKIFISFLDNSSLFRNNYLVDIYPKINFDKVQIIHNFIAIQLSLLFLCKQSYFRH